MRIGIVTDNYFPSVGGTEIAIRNYSTRLEELGHKVFIFCPSYGRNNPEEPIANVVRLPSVRHIYPDHPIMFVYPGIVKEFKKYNLDIIHSQTPISSVYVSEYVSKKLDIPHIFTMHTLIPEQVRRRGGGLFKMALIYHFQSLIISSLKSPGDYLLQDERQTLALKVRFAWKYMLRLVNIPDRVIFPAKHVRELFYARGFNKQAYLLPTFSNMFTSVNNTTYKRHNKELRIVYVGRLDIEKRVQALVDAVNLLPEYLDWKLILIGEGNEQKRLQKLVHKYRLEESIIFKGRCTQREIAEDLKKANVFVLPSYRFETQGIVLLEAAEAYVPIVYCDDNLTVGVENKNSILTKPYAMSLSQGIQKLLENEDLRNELAQGSKQVAQKYRPKKLTKKLENIYEETIAEYKKQR